MLLIYQTTLGRDKIDEFFHQFKVCQILYFHIYTPVNNDFTAFVSKIIYDNDTTDTNVSVCRYIPPFRSVSAGASNGVEHCVKKDHYPSVNP